MAAIPRSYQLTYPAISVIIPTYNSEKYIIECLNSLLKQTFQNFEVIVVDDCSTDNSFAIVEGYVNKFDGRFRLVRTKKNSGGGGYVPRNMGLDLSRGEYIFFIDADDFITENALETLYTEAKKVNADVVYTSAHYFYDINKKSSLILDVEGNSVKKKGLKDNSTLIINDPNKNLQRLLFVGDFRNPWTKFSRRDFLIDNEITFPDIILGGDFIWTIHVYCCSKRFLRLPIPIYFYRGDSSGSVSRKKRAPAEQIFHWLSSFLMWFQSLNKLAKENEILQKKLAYFNKALTLHFYHCLACCLKERMQLSTQNIYEVLYRELDKDSMVPFFFSIIDEQQKKYEEDYRLFHKLSSYFTARADIKFIPKIGAGDFKIFSMSDKKASVNKPAWLNIDGVGYQIQSYVGKLEFVAKATADGKIELNLRGLDVRDPKDESKRIPYWIDYTKLTVNGKAIIDKVTPAWHDKPYRYDINVKTDEKLKVEIEWFPHRVDILPAIPKPVEKPVEFLPNLTARLDVQMVSDTGKGDFQILSVSDKQASVNKPGWLQKDGIGYVIQSYVGKMEFIAKATADGQVTLKLKSMNVRDPEDKSKLVPYWIDYTKLTINGETIIDKLTPAWHDKPYRYDIDVKADEEVKVEVEWFPHRDEVVVEVPKPVEKSVEFLPNLTARLDVQMVSDTGDGDFQILSVSDKRASVNKPGWLQKDGIGYVIQSYVGKMEFVAKATVDGQVTLKLKGMDIHDPENKSKLVPYWIDYTKLTINGETIINKLTPAWHDKPYRYDINVKADEEVKIEVEWFPHRDEVVVEVIKPVEKPVAVEFPPNLTARLDLQMVSDTVDGDFKILSISDDKAKTTKPDYLNRDGIGYVIQSFTGKMELIAKANEDGQVILKLKGMDIRDPKDKSKRVPYWIDYTKLTIDGNTIFDKLTPAWHDKPYRYDIYAEADEEIKIQVEWLAHNKDT